MIKRTLAAALAGVIVLGAWSAAVNLSVGVPRSIEMKWLADDRDLYEMLCRIVPAPGRYVVNPEFTPDGSFPGTEPVFAVQYSGIGHADAWQEMVVALFGYFIATLLAVVLLGHASDAVRARYARRLLFLAGIGSVCAMIGFLQEFGIALHGFADAGILTLADLAAWLAASAVMAGILRPPEPAS